MEKGSGSCFGWCQPIRSLQIATVATCFVQCQPFRRLLIAVVAKCFGYIQPFRSLWITTVATCFSQCQPFRIILCRLRLNVSASVRNSVDYGKRKGLNFRLVLAIPQVIYGDCGHMLRLELTVPQLMDNDSRQVLAIPQHMDSDCGYMFRLELAILQPIDSNHGYMFGQCQPFRSIWIATVVT